MIPQPAQRGGSAKSSAQRAPAFKAEAIIGCLSLAPRQRTSGGVPELFDMELRSLRRDRAARVGVDLFLLERAFDDCLDRISLVDRQFERALLIGCPHPRWCDQLRASAREVDACDPGLLFAKAAGGQQIVEDAWEPAQAAYDLVVAVGTLDTVNDLPRALITLRWAMEPGSMLLGAMSGGETLPLLRAAMREADRVAGPATPHIHPRVEASALAPLLTNAGFTNPVVDVDRVPVSYRRLADLVRDLRRMAATNIMQQRSRTPLTRGAYASAAAHFEAAGDGYRTTETFEILHFAGWSPPA
jgi:hypothetical protein